MRNIGDRDEKSPTGVPRLGVDRIIEVAGVFAVDGDERQFAQIPASLRGGFLGGNAGRDSGCLVHHLRRKFVAEPFRISKGENLGGRVSGLSQRAGNFTGQAGAVNLARLEPHLDQIAIPGELGGLNFDRSRKARIERLDVCALAAFDVGSYRVLPPSLHHPQQPALVSPGPGIHLHQDDVIVERALRLVPRKIDILFLAIERSDEAESVAVHVKRAQYFTESGARLSSRRRGRDRGARSLAGLPGLRSPGALGIALRGAALRSAVPQGLTTTPSLKVFDT